MDPFPFPRNSTQWHDHNVSGQNIVDGLLKLHISMFINRLRMQGQGREGGGEKGVVLCWGRACLYGQQTAGL